MLAKKEVMVTECPAISRDQWGALIWANHSHLRILRTRGLWSDAKMHHPKNTLEIGTYNTN